MPNSEKRAPTPRSLALGIFLILFGLALGGMTFLTLVGPIFGLFVAGLGLFIIWRSMAHGEPPQPLS